MKWQVVVFPIRIAFPQEYLDRGYLESNQLIHLLPRLELGYKCQYYYNAINYVE